jgi:hypothetical protein
MAEKTVSTSLETPVPTLEELLELLFPVLSVPRRYSEGHQEKSVMARRS